MQNRTDVINTALQRCGAAGINIAFQDSQEAAIASAAYERCRKLALAQYAWGFAEKYVALGQDAEAPALGYQYSFSLPGDCVTVVDIHPYTTDDDGAIRSRRMFQRCEAHWELVGRHVYSDAPLLALRYVSDADCPMPEAFANALAWLLAFEIAPYLQQGSKLAGSYYELYQQALDEAKVHDAAQENVEAVPDVLPSKHLRAQFSGAEERW